MKIRSTVTGITALHATVSRRANFLGSNGMRTILRQKADDLEGEFKKNIMGFTPGPVQDLAASTKKEKQSKVGFIYPILVRTYQFINSMYTRVMAPLSGGGWNIKLGFAGSQNGVTNQRIAEIHIKGEGHMPKRDFTKVPTSWRVDLINRIRDALRRL